MNTAIEAFLKANGLKYGLTLVFDEDFVAGIEDVDGDPVYVACGNTPTEALDRLAAQLGAFPGAQR